MDYIEDKNGNLIDKDGNIVLEADKRQKCEIYSRVVGFIRPVSNWNKGKKEEFKERTHYKI